MGRIHALSAESGIGRIHTSSGLQVGHSWFIRTRCRAYFLNQHLFVEINIEKMLRVSFYSKFYINIKEKVLHNNNKFSMKKIR